MLIKLPAWKQLILRSISSCTNRDQLSVAWEFIELFKSRYADILPPLEMYGHSRELDTAYFKQESHITLHQVN